MGYNTCSTEGKNLLSPYSHALTAGFHGHGPGQNRPALMHTIKGPAWPVSMTLRDPHARAAVQDIPIVAYGESQNNLDLAIWRGNG